MAVSEIPRLHFVRKISHRRDPAYAAWSPDGKDMALTDAQCLAVICDPETGQERFLLEGSPQSRGKHIAFVPGKSGENRLLIGSIDGLAILWDYENAAVSWNHRFDREVFGVSVSSDGNKACFCSGYGVYIVEIDTGRLLQHLDGSGKNVLDAKFLSNGTRLVTASEDGMVLLWNLETGSPIRRFDVSVSTSNSTATRNMPRFWNV